MSAVGDPRGLLEGDELQEDEDEKPEALQRTSKRPQIFNKTMPSANTEYEIKLPPNLKKFLIKMRETTTAFILAFEKGRVDTSSPKGPYVIVPVGGNYNEDNLSLDYSLTIYVACGTAGKTLEVIAWS